MVTFLLRSDRLIGLGISSLVDTAIILNYFREWDRIGRTLLYKYRSVCNK